MLRSSSSLLCDNIMFIIEKQTNCFVGGCTILHARQQCTSHLVSLHVCWNLVSLLSVILPFYRYKRQVCYILVTEFAYPNGAEYLFMCLFITWNHLWWNISLSFDHFVISFTYLFIYIVFTVEISEFYIKKKKSFVSTF